MFRLPSWKHHWNPSSFPQVHEPTKGRPRNATHESRPVDAQESRALRNPVQSNSWVHEFRWEFLGEIMENHGKLSWENHGKSMGNDGNLFSGHLFLDEIPHVKKYGIPSTSPRGRTRCLPYAKKKHLLFIHHFWRWNPPLPLAQCISSCFKQFKTICCSSLKSNKCWTCWPYTRISRINSCISKTWKLKSLKTRPWKPATKKRNMAVETHPLPQSPSPRSAKVPVLRRPSRSSPGPCPSNALPAGTAGPPVTELGAPQRFGPAEFRPEVTLADGTTSSKRLGQCKEQWEQCWVYWNSHQFASCHVNH